MSPTPSDSSEAEVEDQKRKSKSEKQPKKDTKDETQSIKKKSMTKNSNRSNHGSHSKSRRSRSDSSEVTYKRFERNDREIPKVCRCLGVFGLSSFTEERDLQDVFSQYGPVEEITLVYDRQSGRSKGFGFVYFKSTSDAVEARKGCRGLKLDGRLIRVDYSLTTEPHPRTPGRYLGRMRQSDDYFHHSQDYDYYDSHCSRSHRDGYRSRRNQDSEREYYREHHDGYRRRSHRFSPFSRCK